MDRGAQMTPKRLPQAPPERPKTETNRSASAPKVARGTFRFWGVRVIPSMISPRAQKRRAQRPGGSFWAPRGRPRFFRGARGGRFGTRKRVGGNWVLQGAPGTPPAPPPGSPRGPPGTPPGPSRDTLSDPILSRFGVPFDYSCSTFRILTLEQGAWMKFVHFCFPGCPRGG